MKTDDCNGRERHAAVVWRGWASKRDEIPGYWSKIHRLECPGVEGSPDSLLCCGRYVPSDDTPPAELHFGDEALALSLEPCAICHKTGNWSEGWNKRKRRLQFTMPNLRLRKKEVAV